MVTNRFAHVLLAAATLTAFNTADARAQFTITLNFSGGGITPSQQVAFTNARNTWQSLVTGYQPGIAITGLTINASAGPIDGVGGTLGSAGPTSGVLQAGFTLATVGSMTFDSADLASLESSGTLGPVILHEMAHVMGFGTIWTQNNVYVNGTGQYTGANALNKYRTEWVGQSLAGFIPVELGGGGGTVDGHWNEVDGGLAPTGIIDSSGRDFRNELMTGWLNTPSFVSDTTLYQFRDIGFSTLSAVPEPTSFLLMGVAGIVGRIVRRRRTALPA